MGTGLNILPFLFFLSLLRSIYAKSSCPITSCGNSAYTIEFPFQLKTHQQPPVRCGYPGFTLSCNAHGVTVLSLPNSGDFFVRSIDYPNQEIQLYDQFNCLPSRLLNLNLSGSPFRAAYYVNYTFLLCPSETTIAKFTVIDCMSNSTRTTLATSSPDVAKEMMSRCETLAASVAVSVLPGELEGFTSELKDDFLLTWDEPDCKYCMAEGNSCGFRDDTSMKVHCFVDRGEGKGNGLRYFIIISFVLPTLACAAAKGLYFVCGFLRNRGGTARTSDDQAATTDATAVIAGLDESTIDSYAKVVLGESKRVPRPNDGACAICLSEYQTNDTVRCIPECTHCFHADCIDQWLRMNRTCPVCRNSSPSAALVNPLVT